MKTSYDKLTKIFTKCPGHLTKMSDMPIYGKKHLQYLLLQDQKADDLGIRYVAFGVLGLPSFNILLVSSNRAEYLSSRY